MSCFDPRWCRPCHLGISFELLQGKLTMRSISWSVLCISMLVASGSAASPVVLIDDGRSTWTSYYEDDPFGGAGGMGPGIPIVSPHFDVAIGSARLKLVSSPIVHRSPIVFTV